MLPIDVPDEELQAALGWREFLLRFPSLRLRRVFDAEQLARLGILVKRARRRDDNYRGPEFGSFYYVQGAPEEELDGLAQLFRQRGAIVERAYTERPAPPPVVAGPDIPGPAYVDPAPIGIDARFAWSKLYFGEGQRAIDIEQGWTFDHEGIKSHGIAEIAGPIVDDYRPHGTSVLGILCGVHDGLGPAGISPHVERVRTVSFDDDAGPSQALVIAFSNLEAGDTLLIEQQAYLVLDGAQWMGPIEGNLLEFELIRLGTTAGVVVVEAGGNGREDVRSNRGLDLDRYQDDEKKFVFLRGERDSGAILVSAASSTEPHERVDYGPFGERIDCYAWGENIHTLDSKPPGKTTGDTRSFGGTSGASAIIAGATLLVQQWAETEHGSRIDSATMRRILSTPELGTKPSGGKPIGVMPNLHAILSAPPSILDAPVV